MRFKCIFHTKFSFSDFSPYNKSWINPIDIKLCESYFFIKIKNFRKVEVNWMHLKCTSHTKVLFLWGFSYIRGRRWSPIGSKIYRHRFLGNTFGSYRQHIHYNPPKNRFFEFWMDGCEIEKNHFKRKKSWAEIILFFPNLCRVIHDMVVGKSKKGYRVCQILQHICCRAPSCRALLVMQKLWKKKCSSWTSNHDVFDEEANFHMALIQKRFRISCGLVDGNRVEAPDDDNRLLCLLLPLEYMKNATFK